MKRVLIVYEEKMALKRLRRVAFLYKQKGRGDSTYQDRGTGIPCNDKRGHARVVSQSAYHPVAKKLPVFYQEIQSDDFKYC